MKGEMKSFRVVGLMSGTSLDGLDLVDVTIRKNSDKKWDFEINHAKMIEYSNDFRDKLQNAPQLSAPELFELSPRLGRFYADEVTAFLDEYQIDRSAIDFIASHGQTIFHQPKKGYTVQLGNGPELSVQSNLPSVVDFRSKDVALGGNGAPLIPVADYLLFVDYADSFLNLGGFSNYSFKENDTVLSFDICPVNSVINHIVKECDVVYDKNGLLGRKEKVNTIVLEQLNKLDYYRENGPKSLGWEWVVEYFLPILNQEPNVYIRLATAYEHIAVQLSQNLNKTGAKNVLITGGGAKNDFLIERVQALYNGNVILPNEQLIDFKEAIGFAFLGVLRWCEQINVWSSVTGAKKDSCSGRICMP